MTCPGCGKTIDKDDATMECSCGYIPVKGDAAKAKGKGYNNYGGDIAKALTSRFTFNQLLIYGGCILLFVSLLFPFKELDDVRVSGLSLVFRRGEELVSLGYLFEFFIPLVTVAVLSLAVGIFYRKLARVKSVVFAVSFTGLYIAAVQLIHLGADGARVPFGIIAFVALWVIVTAAAFLEYRDVHVIKF